MGSDRREHDELDPDEEFTIEQTWSPQDWTSIPNQLSQDPRMSYAAKGVYLTMKSARPGTSWSVGKIESMGTEGRRVVTGALRALREAGWVTMHRLPTGNPKAPFRVVYRVHSKTCQDPSGTFLGGVFSQVTPKQPHPVV